MSNQEEWDSTIVATGKFIISIDGRVVYEVVNIIVDNGREAVLECSR